MIRNIIFDWSGTLVDDLPAVWAATNHCLAKAGVELLSLDRFRAEFQLPVKNFYQRFAGHVPAAQLEAWFHEKFSTVQDDVAPQPRALEFLEFCRLHQVKTCVLSALPEVHYAVQGQKTGFGAFIHKAYLGVRDKRETIRRLLEENHMDPAAAIMIGDMQHDIEAAHAGGIRSVAVLTGYNSLPQLRAARPSLIVEHLGELLRMLESNHFELAPRPPAAGSPPRFPLATVGALIFDTQGRVLLVRTNKWSGLWGIPGGKIEWGETSEAALRREVEEETGLQIGDIRFVMVQDAIRPPEFYREAHFLLLNYTAVAAPGQEVRLNSEGQAYQWIMPEAAAALPLNSPTRLLLETVLQNQKT